MEKNSDKKLKIELKNIQPEIPSERDKLNLTNDNYSTKIKGEGTRPFEDSSTQRETISSKRENNGIITFTNNLGNEGSLVKNSTGSPNKDSSKMSNEERDDSKNQLEKLLENVDGKLSPKYSKRLSQYIYILLNDSESSIYVK